MHAKLIEFGSRGWLTAVCCVFFVNDTLTSAAAETPYVLWATTWTYAWRPNATALSPTGELLVDTDKNSFNQTLFRLDANGKLVSTYNHEGVFFAAMTFDASGNRYVTGGAIETNGVLDVTQIEGLFVAKYNPKDELLWVNGEIPRNPPHYSYGSTIGVDGEGSVLVGGIRLGSMTQEQFAPGDGDGLLLRKYNKDGRLVWARDIEHHNSGRYYVAYLNDLSIDPSGHIVICGYLSPGSTDFRGTTVFPDSSGHSYDGDWYIARFTPNGDLHWVQLGYAQSLATDRNGNIYAAFDWAKDLNEGLAKLSPAGELIWSKDFPGAYVNWPGGVALTPTDEPVFTGRLEATVKFDSITLRPQSSAFADFFVAKADAQGNIQWAMPGGGADLDRGQRVLCDSRGNAFLIGTTRASGSFDGFPLPRVPNTNGLPTVFAAKLSPTPPLKIVSVGLTKTVAWPARATNYVLESTTRLTAINEWSAVTNPVTLIGKQNTIALEFFSTNQFYRLRKQ